MSYKSMAIDTFLRKVICDCGHSAYAHDDVRCWDNHYKCGCKKSQEELISKQLARYEAIEQAVRSILYAWKYNTNKEVNIKMHELAEALEKK